MGFKRRENYISLLSILLIQSHFITLSFLLIGGVPPISILNFFSVIREAFDEIIFIFTRPQMKIAKVCESSIYFDN